MTQYLIEEASFIALELHSAAEIEREYEENKEEVRPGTITDPVMVNAMEKAKALHAQQHGAFVR